MACIRRQVQRRPPVVVLQVGFGSGAQQRGDAVHGALLASKMQRGAAACVLRIGIHPIAIA